MRGKLVCIAGLDGSGKTTQSQLLFNWLKNSNYSCEQIELYKYKVDNTKILRRSLEFIKQNKIEPSYSGMKEIQIAFGIIIAIEEKIVNYLEDGKIVIVDRYIETLGTRFKEKYWPSKILNDAPIPNIYLFIDLLPEICFKRIVSKGIALSPNEDIKALRQPYKYYKSNQDKYNFIPISGNDTPERVFFSIQSTISALI